MSHHLPTMRRLAISLLLTVAGCGAAKSNPAALSEEEAESICTEIRDRANDGTLGSLEIPIAWRALTVDERRTYEALLPYPAELRIGYADIDLDGRTEALGAVHSGGSCSSSTVVLLDDALAIGTIDTGYFGRDKWDEAGDTNLRWAGWGMDERLFRVHGRVVVAPAATLRRPDVVALPHAGRRVPICALMPAGPPAIRVVEDAAGPLCHLIADRRLVALDFDIEVPQQREAWNDYFERVDGGSAMRIDLDGDGASELLGRFSYSSGAGCGGEHMWLAIVGDDGMPLDTALNDLLAPRVQYWRFPRQEFEGAAVYKVGDRYYLYGTAGVEFGLFSIRGGQLQRECRFDAFPQSEIVRRWPLPAELLQD